MLEDDVLDGDVDLTGVAAVSPEAFVDFPLAVKDHAGLADESVVAPCLDALRQVVGARLQAECRALRPRVNRGLQITRWCEDDAGTGARGGEISDALVPRRKGRRIGSLAARMARVGEDHKPHASNSAFVPAAGFLPSTPTSEYEMPRDADTQAPGRCCFADEFDAEGSPVSPRPQVGSVYLGGLQS